jgi:cyclic beta-1,2-glucan synthetase
MHYRCRKTVYHIAVSQTLLGAEGKHGVTSLTVDGVERHDKAIPLVDDHCEHLVEVIVTAETGKNVSIKRACACKRGLIGC